MRRCRAIFAAFLLLSFLINLNLKPGHRRIHCICPDGTFLAVLASFLYVLHAWFSHESVLAPPEVGPEGNEDDKGGIDDDGEEDACYVDVTEFVLHGPFENEIGVAQHDVGDEK